MAVPAPFAEPLWYYRDSSPYYDESHKKLRQFVRDYVENDLMPHAEEWEKEGQVPPEVRTHFRILVDAFVIRNNSTEHFTDNLRCSDYLQAIQTYVEKGFAIIKPCKRVYMGGMTMPAGIEPEKWDVFHNLVVNDELSRYAKSLIVVHSEIFSFNNCTGLGSLVSFGA